MTRILCTDVVPWLRTDKHDFPVKRSVYIVKSFQISPYNNIVIVLREILTAHALVLPVGSSANSSLSVIRCRHVLENAGLKEVFKAYMPFCVFFFILSIVIGLLLKWNP